MYGTLDEYAISPCTNITEYHFGRREKKLKRKTLVVGGLAKRGERTRSRRERKRKKRKGEKPREKDDDGDNDGGYSLRSACPKKKYIYNINERWTNKFEKKKKTKRTAG